MQLFLWVSHIWNCIFVFMYIKACLKHKSALSKSTGSSHVYFVAIVNNLHYKLNSQFFYFIIKVSIVL